MALGQENILNNKILWSTWSDLGRPEPGAGPHEQWQGSWPGLLRTIMRTTTAS